MSFTEFQWVELINFFIILIWMKSIDDKSDKILERLGDE
jgi:hypothetical protein